MSREQYIKNAEDCFKQGKFTDAILFYTKAINIKCQDHNPKLYAKLYNNRGLAYLILNKCDKAIDDFDQALELNPSKANYYYNRGNSHRKLGNLEDAKKDFTKAIELDSIHAKAHNRLGIVLDAQGNYQEAIKYYTKAIKIQPTYDSFYYNRGISHKTFGNFKEAMDDYNAAIGLDPTDADCYEVRGHLFFQLKMFNEALADYSKAIELDPDKDGHHYHRGLINLKLRNYDCAIEDCSTAININPKDSRYYDCRAEAYSKTDQPALAFDDQLQSHRLKKIPSLKDMCKFFILSKHGKMMAQNGVRSFIETTHIKSGALVSLRRELDTSGITPDTISLMRKKQGLPLETTTLFDEIRKEEELAVRLDK